MTSFKYDIYVRLVSDADKQAELTLENVYHQKVQAENASEADALMESISQDVAQEALRAHGTFFKMVTPNAPDFNPRVQVSFKRQDSQI